MNLNLKLILAPAMVAIVFFGCQSKKFQESPDGYKVKFIKKGKGTLPQDGSYVEFNMVYKDSKDSVLFSSEEQGGPIVVPCSMSNWNNGGPLFKAFETIASGDSAILKIPTKTLFEESFKTQVPPNMDQDGEITFYVGMDKVMMPEEYKDYMTKRNEAQKEKDDAIIDKYLADNNIEAKTTDSGLRYVVTQEGNGEFPQPGDSVSVQYNGMLLDGTQFDANTHTFPIGVGQVIPGWDEGIPLFSKGAKGTIYIPSSLAYGNRGAGPVIKPNSILKFDIELKDIIKH